MARTRRKTRARHGGSGKKLKAHAHSPEIKHTDMTARPVSKVIDALKDKKDTLEHMYKNKYKLTEIPHEIKHDLVEFKRIIKNMDESEVHHLIVENKLMDIEETPIDLHDHHNAHSEHMNAVHKNNMKIGWLQKLHHRPVESLVGLHY